MGQNSDICSVQLPVELVDQVQDRVDSTEFDTVNDYVEFVLEEVLFYVEQEQGNNADIKVDESEVEDRLKSLGYLNE